MPKRSSGSSSTGRAGSVSGGSMVAAYAASNPNARNVKATYLGKDAYGNSIYKFSWSVYPRGGVATKTYSVGRSSSGGWTFSAPGSAKARQPNALPAEVDYGTGGSKRSELVDRAVAKLGDLVSRGLLTSEQAKTYNFSNWSDTALRMWISRAGTGNRVTPSVIEGTPGGSAEDAMAGIFDGIGGDGSGGSGPGGGGAIGPVYVAPDKRVVTDFVKGTLVSLVGTPLEHMVGPGVETYMRDHKANWDMEVKASLGKGGSEIDPQQSVLEYIRGSKEYQHIHKLRPEGQDERNWIEDRRKTAIQAGLSTGTDEFAVNQAIVGGDLEDVQQAAAVQEFATSGQAPSIIENQFRAAVQNMFAGVGR